MKDIKITTENTVVITPQETNFINQPVTLQPVRSGDFTGMAYQLPDNFDYYVGIDPAGQKILVPVNVKG